MQEHCQVSLATNEVGDNQLSSCFQPAPVCPLCEALLAVAAVPLVPVPAAVRKDGCVLRLPRVPVESVLGAVVLSVL